MLPWGLTPGAVQRRLASLTNRLLIAVQPTERIHGLEAGASPIGQDEKRCTVVRFVRSLGSSDRYSCQICFASQGRHSAQTRVQMRGSGSKKQPAKMD